MILLIVLLKTGKLSEIKQVQQALLGIDIRPKKQK